MRKAASDRQARRWKRARHARRRRVTRSGPPSSRCVTARKWRNSSIEAHEEPPGLVPIEPAPQLIEVGRGSARLPPRGGLEADHDQRRRRVFGDHEAWRLAPEERAGCRVVVLDPMAGKLAAPGGRGTKIERGPVLPGRSA